MQNMVGINNRSTNNTGLRHALPDRQNINGGLLVSRLARGEFGEASHHKTSGIGESYALLSSIGHLSRIGCTN